MIHTEAITFLWPHGRLRGLTPGLPVGPQLAPQAAPTICCSTRAIWKGAHTLEKPHDFLLCLLILAVSPSLWTKPGCNWSFLICLSEERLDCETVTLSPRHPLISEALQN